MVLPQDDNAGHSYRATANAYARSCYQNLSVCLSVRHVHCDKMKETSAHIFVPYDRLIILFLRQEKCLVGDDSLYLKFWAKLTRSCKNAHFQSIFTCSASAITPSEKSSIIANTKSTMCFPMSLR